MYISLLPAWWSISKFDSCNSSYARIDMPAHTASWIAGEPSAVSNCTHVTWQKNWFHLSPWACWRCFLFFYFPLYKPDSTIICWDLGMFFVSRCLKQIQVHGLCSCPTLGKTSDEGVNIQPYIVKHLNVVDKCLRSWLSALFNLMLWFVMVK